MRSGLLRKKLQMYMTMLLYLMVLMGWAVFTTFFSSESLVSESNGACVGLALALVVWHWHCHTNLREIVAFRINRPGMGGLDYLMTMIGSGLSHADWSHIGRNVLSLLLWQLRPCASTDPWKRALDSPLALLALFLGGCVAGCAAEAYAQGTHKRLVHARTAAVAHAIKQALSRRSPARIPGLFWLAGAWDPAASFAADWIAALRTLPQRAEVILGERRACVGASHSVCAVAAAAAARCFADYLKSVAECDGVRGLLAEAPRILLSTLPISFFLAELGNDLRHSLARCAGHQSADRVAHAAHAGGAAFGLAAAALAALAAAARPPPPPPPPPPVCSRAAMGAW